MRNAPASDADQHPGAEHLISPPGMMGGGRGGEGARSIVSGTVVVGETGRAATTTTKQKRAGPTHALLHQGRSRTPAKKRKQAGELVRWRKSNHRGESAHQAPATTFRSVYYSCLPQPAAAAGLPRLSPATLARSRAGEAGRACARRRGGPHPHFLQVA